MAESYECFELNTCSECEEPNCTCDCHDEQEFTIFYGWQDIDRGDGDY